jgi:hypothetical protein
LAIALEFCDTSADFSLVVEGYTPDQVETAIALQDSQPVRQRLRLLYEEAAELRTKSGQTDAIAKRCCEAQIAPTEPATELTPVEGCRVRVKERLLDNRPSLMAGLDGVVKAISALGRLTVESLGRIEYFSQSEVELLPSG